MNTRIGLAVIALASVLVACHGGFVPATAPANNTLAPTHNAAAARVTAWGVLVDDPSGKPLAHEPVKLMPWKACTIVTRRPETVRCPNPVATTTTVANGHFSLHAPPGHYLLVIGSDSTTDRTRPTIHDNLTIAASPSTQHLLAPGICTYNREPHCLPPIGLYTPHPMEVNGDYRLSNLTGRQPRLEELPCITAFDAGRQRRGLFPVVVDEWATENVRAAVHRFTAGVSSTPPPVDAFGFLTSGNVMLFGGSPPCPMISEHLWHEKFAPQYISNPQTFWFAGTYDACCDNKKTSAFGTFESPPDPRTGFKDPYSPAYWP